MNLTPDLLSRAAVRKPRLVFADGADPAVAAAAERLESAGFPTPLLVGGKGINPAKDDRLGAIAQRLRERHPDRVRDGIDALDQAADPLRFGAGLTALKEADGCIGGSKAGNVDVLRAALWAFGPAEGIDRVSSAFYLKTAFGILTLSDCAINPQPTPAVLASIALAAVRDRTRLIGDKPRVAFLSYATGRSAQGPLVDHVRQAVDRFRTLAPGVAVDGPLQADAALEAEAAHHKAPGSPVAGKANILIFPDLNAGNITFRLLKALGGVRCLGPLLQGLARPMTGLSRGAVTDDIVEMAALVALQGAQSTIQGGV
ncbi:MAG: phosphate acyltransferase [Gemmatimonadota bacterium]